MKKIVLGLFLVVGFSFGNDIDEGLKAYQDANYQKAFKHFKLACDGGEAGGCGNLGVLYAKGQGIRQNYNEAFKHFKLACDGGEALDCYNLGLLYDRGDGIRQSYPMAKEYFGRACDLGLQIGCEEYAKLNKKGY